MNAGLVRSCEMLSTNYNIIRKTLFWDSGYMTTVSALIATMQNKLVTPEELKSCKKLLKQNTGLFSSMRGYTLLPIIMRMCAAHDPLLYLTRVQDCYAIIRSMSFLEMGNDFKVLAAMAIADRAEPGTEMEAVQVSQLIFDRMRANHPLLTQQTDYPFAAMLALTGRDVNTMIAEMEEAYDILKPAFFSKNTVQTLSQLLTLDPRPIDVKVEKIVELQTKLKELKYHFNFGNQVSVLACLSQLNVPADTLVEAIRETDAYLKKKRGFGSLSMNRNTRLFYTAQIVLNEYANTSDSEPGDVLPNVALTVAVETAIMIAIAAASASASRSASSNSGN